jgi:hypothetical protein
MRKCLLSYHVQKQISSLNEPALVFHNISVEKVLIVINYLHAVLSAFQILPFGLVYFDLKYNAMKFKQRYVVSLDYQASHI